MQHSMFSCGKFVPWQEQSLHNNLPPTATEKLGDMNTPLPERLCASQKSKSLQKEEHDPLLDKTKPASDLLA